ncbi:MAG: gliding motility lipoprotein GldD [Bacteroidales bacterium]|nr:gliding motility lipoprotein GldD [Bacteroidales bacterium]
MPKPKGYLRIDLPERAYQPFDSAQHFRFDYSAFARVDRADQKAGHDDWYTIVYPQFKAEVYVSYKAVDKNLPVFLEDARTLALTHLPKASGIADSIVIVPENKVYGNFYFIQGKGVASPIQFYLTDSVHHFVRGALYFGFRPENDSIAPVIHFLKDDLRHLAGSLEWK